MLEYARLDIFVRRNEIKSLTMFSKRETFKQSVNPRSILYV